MIDCAPPQHTVASLTHGVTVVSHSVDLWADWSDDEGKTFQAACVRDYFLKKPQDYREALHDTEHTPRSFVSNLSQELANHAHKGEMEFHSRLTRELFEFGRDKTRKGCIDDAKPIVSSESTTVENFRKVDNPSEWARL